MLFFDNDYSEGAHKKVLEHLVKTNMEQLPGDGEDHYFQTAKDKLCRDCGFPAAAIF